MAHILKKTVSIPCSRCDRNAVLTFGGLVTLLMDAACEYTDQIGLGWESLRKKQLMWMIVKSEFVIHAYPAALTQADISVWSDKPGSVSCNFYYTMTQNGQLLAEGKNRWILWNYEQSRVERIGILFSDITGFCDDTSCNVAYAKIDPDFSTASELGSYQVRSEDIDTGRHMNNAAYLRCVLNAFSCDELESMTVNRISVHYLAQAFEKEELTLRMRIVPHAKEIGVLKSSDQTCAVIRLETCSQ